MDRREFLKQVALWSAGLIIAPPVFQVIPSAIAKQTTSTLCTGAGTDYATLVTKVLAPFGGIKAYVKKGAKVVIKPNIGWDRNPAQAADTHPLIVKTLVKSALDAGAGKVMVFDRPCNDQRRCYANSGIKEAVESLKDKRVICDYIDERKFTPVKIKNGKAIKEWSFYKDAIEADCYINVPIAKHHGLSKLTLGLKNIMGVIGGMRGIIHQNMGQNLADLNTVIKSHLTIIDATRILLKNGPSGGNLNDVKVLNTIIASTDIVAADAYATSFFKMKPEDVDSIVAAYNMGLGEMNLSKVKIVKV